MTKNNTEVHQRVMGCIAGALIGDSMGAATEGMEPSQIRELFGGDVEVFLAPPTSTFASGREPGQLTDDSTQMLELLEAEIETAGDLTVESVVSHLLKWADNEELFSRFAGPTTRRAIKDLREGKSPLKTGLPGTPIDVVTDGAAMKVAPIGLAHPGDPDSAIRDAITMCIPTHNTNVAYAGAAAIAAAVSVGLMPDATILSMIDAAIYGASEGDKAGREQAGIVSSPSLVERIKLAVGIGASEPEFQTSCERLRNLIGCGLPIIEAVPAAIGLFVAARGNPNRAILGAVNIGGDADTVATIAGAIAGAYAGIEDIETRFVETIERVNGIHISSIATRVLEIHSV